MASVRPNNFTFDVLVYENGGITNPYFMFTKEKLYARKKTESKHMTFIVFSSSETILTGRYDQNMKENYEFFTKVLVENKERIMEVVLRPKISLMDYIKSLAAGKEFSL
jgi:hypothetical protein